METVEITQNIVNKLIQGKIGQILPISFLHFFLLQIILKIITLGLLTIKFVFGSAHCSVKYTVPTSIHITSKLCKKICPESAGSRNKWGITFGTNYGTQ
jgi:hypothetical protein